MKLWPGLVDTHVHLDALPGPDNPQAQAREAGRCGVAGFVVPGVEADGWSRLLAVARGVPGARPAPGLHPAAAGQWDEALRERLAALLADPGIVAIGEIGLDASPGLPSTALQEQALRGQLRLALASAKPVLLHCRQATGRLFQILREEQVAEVGGILHAFSGSLETAQEAERLGLAVGLGGVVTYPNADRLRRVVAELPAEMIVLETDAPDLSPHPFRGTANRPARLRLIAEKVAEVRGWSLEALARQTTANAARVLRVESWTPDPG